MGIGIERANFRPPAPLDAKACARLPRRMDPARASAAYARYQATVWEDSRAWARRALGDADPAELRRAANRRFVRECLTYRAWLVRQSPVPGREASHAWLATA